MVHNSMIDKLSKQANVSYADAREALEMTEWDVLDAYVWLEAQGKIDSMTDAANETQEAKKPAAPETRFEEKKDAAPLGFFATIGRILKENRLFIRAKDGRQWSVTLLAMILLVMFFRKAMLIGFLIALCCQVKFSFEGPDMPRKQKKQA